MSKEDKLEKAIKRLERLVENLDEITKRQEKRFRPPKKKKMTYELPPGQHATTC